MLLYVKLKNVHERRLVLGQSVDIIYSRSRTVLMLCARIFITGDLLACACIALSCHYCHYCREFLKGLMASSSALSMRTKACPNKASPGRPYRVPCNYSHALTPRTHIHPSFCTLLGQASLRVNCSQTRIEVSVITQPRLVGGLLEYVCSTSGIKVCLIMILKADNDSKVFRTRSRAHPFFVECC